MYPNVSTETQQLGPFCFPTQKQGAGSEAKHQEHKMAPTQNASIYRGD